MAAKTAWQRAKIAKNKRANFSINLRIMKQVAPRGISRQTMDMANELAHDLLDRLFDTAEAVRKYDDKGTLSARHVQVATRALLRTELASHAVSEATKAVQKFAAA